MKHGNPQHLEEGKEAGFKQTLESVLDDFKIAPLNDAQIAQIVAHYDLMMRWNRRTNLTRIVIAEDAARLHYGESLLGAQFVGAAKTVLDIGSGPGFPAIPLAVILPDIEVTALEANHKKALFLQEAKDALRLVNFKIASARVETFDLSPFDLLTSRALDRAEDLLPQILNKMNAEQRLMLYCAPAMIDHLKQAADKKYQIDVHQIPESASRLVALFSLTK
jgi:16S rRNA (guanine527-N7)-methyltransferase